MLSALQPRGTMPGPQDVTQALTDLTAGDPEALDRLLPVVYENLRGIARRELRRERPDHTLNATALVHEAYLRLVQLDRIDWAGRAHFFGAAAQAMRRILISYARMKKAEKRAVCDDLASRLGASVAGIVGHVGILYRPAREEDRRRIRV